MKRNGPDNQCTFTTVCLNHCHKKTIIERRSYKLTAFVDHPTLFTRVNQLATYGTEASLHEHVRYMYILGMHIYM